jgi:hypothetical protein
MALLGALALAGCSTRSLSFDEATVLSAPTFAPRPENPAQSPQLDAIALRDTAGLSADDTPIPSVANLRTALAEFRLARPDVTRLNDLSFDEDNVWLDYLDPDVPGRSIGAFWRPDYGLSFDDPEFTDDTSSYPMDRIDVDALGALIDGLHARFPTLSLGWLTLSVSRSYQLGLTWVFDLSDARGTLATVFADLDGTVVAVAMDD